MDHDLKIEIDLILDDWFVDNCLIDPESTKVNFDIRYVVEYDILTESEIRRFELINLEISEKVLILKEEYSEDISKLIINNDYLDLKEAIVVKEEHLIKSLESIEELKSKSIAIGKKKCRIAIGDR